jgi:hypothetical protein
MGPEAPQLFVSEFLLQIATVRSPLFLHVIGKSTRASQSTGIFLEMERAHIDRNIRIEVFKILQLEIDGGRERRLANI